MHTEKPREQGKIEEKKQTPVAVSPLVELPLQMEAHLFSLVTCVRIGVPPPSRAEPFYLPVSSEPSLSSVLWGFLLSQP